MLSKSLYKVLPRILLVYFGFLVHQLITSHLQNGSGLDSIIIYSCNKSINIINHDVYFHCQYSKLGGWTFKVFQSQICSLKAKVYIAIDYFFLDCIRCDYLPNNLLHAC